MSPYNAYSQSGTLKIDDNYTAYFDSLGFMHIVGEVINTSDNTYQYVEVTAYVYDKNDKIISVDSGYLLVNYLLPHSKAPFEIIITTSDIKGSADSYRVEITDSSIAHMPKQALKILSCSDNIDSLGFMHVICEVQNNGSGTSTFTQLIVTTYDKNGNVVEVDFTYTEPSSIEPGQKAAGEAIITNNVERISDYVVIAQSNEYVLLTENAQSTNVEEPTNNIMLYGVGFTKNGYLATLTIILTDSYQQIAYTDTEEAYAINENLVINTDSGLEISTVYKNKAYTIACNSIEDTELFMCVVGYSDLSGNTGKTTYLITTKI